MLTRQGRERRMSLVSRNFRLIFGGILPSILILLILQGRGTDTEQPQRIDYPPLLLNSGLIESREAEVRVIFWFEDQSGALESEVLNDQVFSQTDWEWETHEKEGSASKHGAGLKQALTVSGYRKVNALEEAQVLAWFGNITQKVERAGGKAYFDERVQAGVDIEAYLSQNDFEPKQWAISGTTASIAGWQKGLLPAVHAGQDSVNIQLLTRSTSQGEKTVLAIPVLLEEF